MRAGAGSKDQPDKSGVAPAGRGWSAEIDAESHDPGPPCLSGESGGGTAVGIADPSGGFFFPRKRSADFF
jgi:hypothetical protein